MCTVFQFVVVSFVWFSMLAWSIGTSVCLSYCHTSGTMVCIWKKCIHVSSCLQTWVSWVTFRFNSVIQCNSFDELHFTLSKLIVAFVFASFDVPLRCKKLYPCVSKWDMFGVVRQWHVIRLFAAISRSWPFLATLGSVSSSSIQNTFVICFQRSVHFKAHVYLFVVNVVNLACI